MEGYASKGTIVVIAKAIVCLRELIRLQEISFLTYFLKGKGLSYLIVEFETMPCKFQVSPKHAVFAVDFRQA